MGNNVYIQLFNFIKEKEIVTLDEIKDKFSGEEYNSIYHNLLKISSFGIKKIKKGLYAYENYSDFYLLLVKLNPGNILAYHTALEFYGLGHSAFFTAFIMNTKSYYDIPQLEGKTIKYVKPTIDQYDIIIKNNQSYRVTSLEATFLDCLLNLKYCGGFEEFYRCITGVEAINNTGLNKSHIGEIRTKNVSTDSPPQFNINYLKELLTHYDIQKLYNLTGFMLEKMFPSLLETPYLKEFLKFLQTKIRVTPVKLEESPSNTYINDKKWNVNYPKEFETLFRGEY